ncbi:MAG: haloacid dehalogenase type II [Gammaproteobacteria bacterium]|nr:haloacid dehalogenase type II [Gammaproteobacteria bacterium]
MQIKALLFDVFGTVVDWRTSIINEGHALGKQKDLNVDWEKFADAWRGLYQPSMEKVRIGERSWTLLDQLHRESLEQLLQAFAIEGLSESEIDHFNRAWHRLQPWPDVVEGLKRLKSKFIIGTLSNGNIALLVNMAKHGGLPWDMILGAEVARSYKPLPDAYLLSAQALDLKPQQCLMVAAHNNDLFAAAELGFHTAFVARPTEYGPQQDKDLQAKGDFDFVAKNFIELAVRLGA